jgi:hypothetical protein
MSAYGIYTVQITDYYGVVIEKASIVISPKTILVSNGHDVCSETIKSDDLPTATSLDKIIEQDWDNFVEVSIGRYCVEIRNSDGDVDVCDIRYI